LKKPYKFPAADIFNSLLSNVSGFCRKSDSFIHDIHDLNALLLERQHSPASLVEPIYWRTKSGRHLAQVRKNIIEEAQRVLNY